MKKHLLYLLLPLALGCGSEKKPQEPLADTLGQGLPQADHPRADTLITAPQNGIETTTLDEQPAPVPLQQEQEAAPKPQEQPEPKNKPGKQKPGKQPADPKQPTTGDAKPVGEVSEPGSSAQAQSTYRLMQVQGESLPLVINMTTECDVKLLRGELQLKAGSVRFKSYTAEECAGQRKPEIMHEAAGTYQISEGRIFINVTSGDALGDAEGVIEGKQLRLLRISNDEEQQEVDWRFMLQ